MQQRTVREARFESRAGLALEHGDIGSGLYEIVRGRQTCEAGADDDDMQTNPLNSRHNRVANGCA